MRLHRLAAGLVLFAPLAGCKPKSDAAVSGSTTVAPPAATADAGAARQAIEAANRKFIDALKRGDTATAAANYADDAVVMMPNEQAWIGRPAVAKGFFDFTSQMALKDMKATTEDVTVSGDLAVERGSYEMTLQPKTGKQMVDKGKYLTVWKRQPDGSWKIIRDINNTSLPAKG